MNPSVRQAIAAIPEQAWTTISYPNAIFEQDEQRWISEAEVAEIDFTAFTSHPKKRQVTCRLVVRRVQRLNKATIAAADNGGYTQDELFTLWRHHGFVTNSTLDHRRRRRDPPRPRHHRAGHRRAEGRPAGARPVGEVHRERRLARPGRPRVQPPTRRRLRRLSPSRQSPVGHPAHPPHHHPRPDRLLRPSARAAPADRLALGRPPGKTSGPPPPPDRPAQTAPRKHPTVEKPGRPADPPHPPTPRHEEHQPKSSTTVSGITFGGSRLSRPGS